MQQIDQNKLEAKNILNTDYSGKRILIRTCLNVAMDKSGNITDATRIEESAPTLKTLGEKANKVIMMAHLGRPTTAREPEFSLEPVRLELEKRLGEQVTMIKDESEFGNIIDGKYYLLENIRYFEGEEAKDLEVRKAFAQKLAALGEIFVNDAFADYREAASTYDIAEILPSYLGPVFVKEIKAISYFNEPARPFVAVLGGAKLSEKLDALLALAKQADKVLVGGAMAYTLQLSQGIGVGKSLIEEDKLAVAKQVMEQYKDKLVLPSDHVVASEFSAESPSEIIGNQDIPADKQAIDIGPRTQAEFVDHIQNAKSILWNGPMGVSEWESAKEGTQKIVQAIVSNSEAYKFAGGGDSIAAINKFGLTGFDHVSTGGGAMLAFVSYDEFPTLDVILKKD